MHRLELRSLIIKREGFAAGPFNFVLKEGDKALVYGPNGYGKTTLLMSIAGILSYEGSVLLDEREVRSVSLERRGITYAPARPSLINGASVLDNLKMSGNEALEIAERFNLRSILQVKAGGLNEGARKMVQIAMALGSSSVVVLIDEPFAFLSLQNAKLVLDEIARAREKIIVITSHERLEGFTSYIDMEKYQIKG